MKMIKLPIPKKENSFFTFRAFNILPHDSSIFVFGSNKMGAHSLGAAKLASTRYGAVRGISEGFTGNCYAIPTKGYYVNNHLEILSLEQIKTSADKFIEVTKTSGKHFYVTPIGTGLAGYKHEQIAPLFIGAENCWFPDIWEPYLKNVSKKD